MSISSGRRNSPLRSPLSAFSSVPRISHPRVTPSGPSLNVDHEKNKVIRSLCNQISHGLNDASEFLDDDSLQELCAEIAKYSQGAIRRKQEAQQPKEDLLSTGCGSLQNAINERMAAIVENESSLPFQQRPIQEGRILSSQNNKSSLNSFPKPQENDQYDAFLNICDPHLMTNPQQLRRDYIAFKRSDLDIPFVLFLLPCGVVLVETGFVWSIDINTYINHPTAALSILFAVLCAFTFSFVALNRIAFLSFRYNIVCLQWYHKYVTKLYDSSYGQWPENAVIVCSALASGFYLINIVLMKLCDPDMIVNVGNSNHLACDSFVQPPPQSYIFPMINILLLQIAVRGVSRAALVCSWIICLVAVNTSIYLSNSGNYVWMNILQLFFVCVSYQLERQPLRMYLKTLKAIEAGEVAAKLKVRLNVTAGSLKAKQSMVSKQSHLSNIFQSTSSHHLVYVSLTGSSHWSRDSYPTQCGGCRGGHVDERTRIICCDTA